MRLLILLVVAACASPPRPDVIAHSLPPPTTRQVLDPFESLVGCWRHWSVDWGFRICWKREGTALLGRYESGGSMGAHDILSLRIQSSLGELQLSLRASCGPIRGEATCTPNWINTAYLATPIPPAMCTHRWTAEACRSAKPLVMFGNRENSLWIGFDPASDEMLWGRYPLVQRMSRVR